jgi:hypothetical protein
VEVEACWQVDSLSSLHTYAFSLTDDAGNKLVCGDQRPFPRDTKAELRETFSVPVPLKWQDGRRFNLCLEVFDFDRLKYLSAPDGKTLVKADNFVVEHPPINSNSRFQLLSESPSGIRLYENKDSVQ